MREQEFHSWSCCFFVPTRDFICVKCYWISWVQISRWILFLLLHFTFCIDNATTHSRKVRIYFYFSPQCTSKSDYLNSMLSTLLSKAAYLLLFFYSLYVLTLKEIRQDANVWKNIEHLPLWYCNPYVFWMPCPSLCFVFNRKMSSATLLSLLPPSEPWKTAHTCTSIHMCITFVPCTQQHWLFSRLRKIDSLWNNAGIPIGIRRISLLENMPTYLPTGPPIDSSQIPVTQRRKWHANKYTSTFATVDRLCNRYFASPATGQNSQYNKSNLTSRTPPKKWRFESGTG